VVIDDNDNDKMPWVLTGMAEDISKAVLIQANKKRHTMMIKKR